jgi:integral membrane sensor domain MASE1
MSHALSSAATPVDPTIRPARPRRHDLGVVAAVFVAFTFFAFLAWESFGSSGGPSFFYPAAGVTVAAMMLSRRGLWPGIAAAVAAAEILVDTLHGSGLWTSAGFAAANVVEPVVGAALVLAWCGGPPDLRVRRDFARFIAGACLFAPVFGALIGGTASSLHYGSPWLHAAVTWWAGDALGVLVMASPILLWRVQSSIVRRRPWEMAAVLVVTSLLSVATFWTDFPPSILILPVLAFAAFRLDMLGAALGGAVAAFLANIMSTRGLGLYIDVHLSQNGRVVVTQIYVAVMVVVAMLIAQEAAARASAVQQREAERRERIRLETLSRLAHRLSGALTAHDIGRALSDHVLNDAGARALNLGLLSPNGRTLEWVTRSGYPAAVLSEFGGSILMRERAVATDVVRMDAPITIQTVSEYTDTYPGMARWSTLSGAQSVVGWPLSSGGDAFGALILVWTEPQQFGQAQLSYISAVATMVSQALVRAKIYADEHARASVLHSVAQPETRVSTVGLEYRALYLPADEEHGVGGDWYSVVALPGGATYLSVGDVIGHGLASVEDMAQLRTSGNAYAHQGMSAAQVLNELNRFAAHQIRGEFATNLVAVFDPEYSSLSYSSAGHPPALLRRAATGEILRLDEANGPMLGPFEETVYVQSTVSVEPGDVLIMYTDGLVEHHDGNLRAGIAHLEYVIAAWPPEALLDCEALVREVAPAPHTDDLCVLGVRFGTP